MRRPWVYPLRTHVTALLIVTMLVTFGVVAVFAVLWRVPQMERLSRSELQGEVADVTEALELMLTARQAQMAMLADLLSELPPEQAPAVLDQSIARSQTFETIYLLSPQGRVEAVGLPQAWQARREDFMGSDLSANAAVRSVQARRSSVWSSKHLSIASGTTSVLLAYPIQGGRVLLGEVPLTALLRILRVAAGNNASSIWVVDQAGEVLADTQGGRHVGRLNVLNWPLLQDLQRGRSIAPELMFERQRFQSVALRAQALDWYVVGLLPSGLDYPATRRLLGYVLAASLGSLAIGLMITPYWARSMARPVQNIVARAARTTAGRDDGQAWPRSAIAEFNSLSQDLQAMATRLQDREQTFLAIFAAMPMPMCVADAAHAFRLIYVNDAWCHQMGYCRDQALGRTSVEIGLLTEHERRTLHARMQDGTLMGEATVLRADGHAMTVQMYAQRLSLPTQELLVWSTIDTEPQRHVERELRELNHLLEARVEQRASALTSANEALAQTVARVRRTQDELVNAGKMAALGGLVAGVAHELNTPLGNGVMAVSALADVARGFELKVRSGLTRADLQRFVDDVAQGVDIAERNLRRAAELILSFKQVAVDQTSAQRRSFELSEVVHEIVTSLRPSFNRTPYRIELDVPPQGLRLDSYPGALSQTIGNLVQNAMLHGFDGRHHGTVRIAAERVGADSIVLRVSDDGKGIAPEHLSRVFDPFMTTKMGRGGSGLGLHISYTAVVQLLGGMLTAHSVQGEGACFEMRLPTVAPRHADSGVPAGNTDAGAAQ
jgi:PAS domain S-box-containing protein